MRWKNCALSCAFCAKTEPVIRQRLIRIFKCRATLVPIDPVTLPAHSVSTSQRAVFARQNNHRFGGSLPASGDCVLLIIDRKNR